ncbi:MAG: ABC transporter permease, partial [Acetatifactor sp.]|nr:ABC transporter permease [Acetatifactor sp.]
SMQSALVTWLESIPEVRRVNYSELTANTLSGVNLLIAYVSMGIIIILLAVSIFLISNTVAIGISVRSAEINIMKYIGATDFFVRAPFVLEGMLIGLMGAAIPLGIIYSIYNYALTYVLERFSILSSFLNFLSVDELFGFLTPVSLVVGIGIGFLGSFSTVRKHLRV